jgi:hypothetical protein
MFKSGFPLSNDEMIQAALHNKTVIIVIQHGLLLEYSGLIVAHSEDSVTLDNGDKYLKAICEFRVR